MATRQRASSSSDDSTAKHQVQKTTFEKWQRELDKEYSSCSWLGCVITDKANRSLVSTLWYKVCREFEDRIIGVLNYSSAWIDGSSNHRTSNIIIDHAKSDQHKAAMNAHCSG